MRLYFVRGKELNMSRRYRRAFIQNVVLKMFHTVAKEHDSESRLADKTTL